MQIIGSDPFSIKKQYNNRNITNEYNNIIKKAKDPETITHVINSIKKISKQF